MGEAFRFRGIIYQVVQLRKTGRKVESLLVLDGQDRFFTFRPDIHVLPNRRLGPDQPQVEPQASEAQVKVQFSGLRGRLPDLATVYFSDRLSLNGDRI